MPLWHFIPLGTNDDIHTDASLTVMSLVVVLTATIDAKWYKHEQYSSLGESRLDYRHKSKRASTSKTMASKDIDKQMQSNMQSMTDTLPKKSMLLLIAELAKNATTTVSEIQHNSCLPWSKE